MPINDDDFFDFGREMKQARNQVFGTMLVLGLVNIVLYLTALVGIALVVKWIFF